jgi:hypothetical protein
MRRPNSLQRTDLLFEETDGRVAISSEFLNVCVVPLTIAIASVSAMPFFRSLSTAVDREGLVGGSMYPELERPRALSCCSQVLGSS